MSEFFEIPNRKFFELNSELNLNYYVATKLFVVFYLVRVPYCIFKLAMIWYLIINTIFTLCPHTETIASYRDLYLKARAGHERKTT